MAADEELIHCGQMLNPSDDCCAGTTTCSAAAAWIHRESGLALCEVHERNARIFGGVKFGEWTVGTTKVPYPAGWFHADTGAPLVVDEVAAPSTTTPKPAAAPAFEVPGGTVRPSGLIIP
ncbi:MAG: hypothetical protein AMXMBFR23_19020 [Chloroflexota bacterium]